MESFKWDHLSGVRITFDNSLYPSRQTNFTTPIFRPIPDKLLKMKTSSVRYCRNINYDEFRIWLSTVMRMIESTKVVSTSFLVLDQCSCRVNGDSNIHVQVLKRPDKRPTMEHLMRINHKCIHVLNSRSSIG